MPTNAANKERIYIITVGCVLLLIGAAYRFFPDIQGAFTANSAVRLKEKQIEKYRKIIQRGPRDDAVLVDLGRALERSESILLDGNTSALSGIEIQNIIGEILYHHQVETKTVKVMRSPKKKRRAYPQVSVRFVFDASVRQLKDVMIDIHNAGRLLVVDELIVSLTKSGPSGNNVLSTSMLVTGYRKHER